MSIAIPVLEEQTLRTDFTFSYVKSIGFYANIKDRRLNPIPSNTIIYKSLTGIGATTAEILEKRNSIIVLPNLPVIRGKQIKHGIKNRTFAVHEDTKLEDLIDYLLNIHIKHKKILTTPESFIYKVKVVMKRLGVDMYQQYFLLFDESHKFILDNNYREQIVLPFDDFFKFINKAMISATPLRLSDPRFKEQNFINATINPVYYLKQDLKVIHTNNISYALRKYIHENPNRHHCIFYNSVDGIKSVMKNLEIESESRIFCSTFSKRELNIQGYEDVHSEFNKQPGLAKYNFFISSFYNGLDIELGGVKPNLILITSLKFADHTVIDPYTDTVQIAGRIRNGISGFVHITNTNADINFLSSEEIVEQVNVSAVVYKAFQSLKEAAFNPFAKQLYSEALDRVSPYSNLLNKPVPALESKQVEYPLEELDPVIASSINYFKLDNFLYHNKVKGYYAHINKLIDAYEQTKKFNITQEVSYCLLDKMDMLKRFGGKYTSVLAYQDITNTLLDMEGLKFNDPFEYNRSLRILEQQFSLIVNAYFKLGIDKMYALEFKHRRIQQAVIKSDAEAGMNNHAVIDAVYNQIRIGSRLTCVKIKAILTGIYQDFNIKKNATSTDIKHFFKIRENVKVKVMVNKEITWQRGYEFIEPLFNVHSDYRRS